MFLWLKYRLNKVLRRIGCLIDIAIQPNELVVNVIFADLLVFKETFNTLVIDPAKSANILKSCFSIDIKHSLYDQLGGPLFLDHEQVDVSCNPSIFDAT